VTGRETTHRAPVPDAILGRVMLAFVGDALPASIADRLRAAPAAGLTLFRAHNVRTPGQVRELTAAFQRAGAAWGTSDGRPMLVAADQEGGQLVALGDASTAFAGNMALGAVNDLELTERVAFAIGSEARAMGVNVVYGPCLDLATDPRNPALGVRSFGDDPGAVARHGSAFVRGLQRAGVAATVKHAPGMGHGSVDTHHGLGVIETPRAVLDEREFVPFRAGFAAADDLAVPRLAMLGHAAIPAVTGRGDLPGSLSRAVITDLLRGTLGFRGVTISDALDMAAVAGASSGAPDVVAAIEAGEDLLLTAADPVARDRIETALSRAAATGRFATAEDAAATARLDALRGWLGAHPAPPDIDVVGCPAHRALEAELATRSITLVRDPGGLVASAPLRPAGKVVAIMPRPADLTPADTSSLVAPGLADALRHAAPATTVEDIVVAHRPEAAEIAAVLDRVRIGDADLVVIGTIDAHRQPEQLALVEALAATGRPLVAVALRGPWDVARFPARVPALATYSIHPPSLDALAAVLAGEATAPGQLPVVVDPARG
jgi:beta-N-acetylhexosaminidase